VTEQLYSERMPIEVAAKQMGIGNRAELNRWLLRVNEVLSAVVVDG